MSRKLAIIGAGGHGKVVGEIALLNNYNDVHFFDNKADKIKEYPFSIAGNLNHLEKNKIGRRRVGKECRSRWSPYH